jgi:hypothetical protein
MPTEPFPRTSLPRFAGFAVTALLVIALTGCATGERPDLEPAQVVDDPAAAVVLQRLERAGSVPFTATYDITPSTTGATTTAIVRQLDGKRRITIGDIDYQIDGGSSRTCKPSGECVDFIDDARVSDLNITHRFWADAIAARLTIDAARRVGFSTGRTDTIAGRPAVCADVPVLGGTVVYCALDAGVLARYINADVSIELTSFSSDVDAGALSSDVDQQP